MKSALYHLGMVVAVGLLASSGDAAAVTTDLSGLPSMDAPIPLRQADPPPGSLPPPPKESDRVFVGRGTSVCTFKSNGPIRINVKTRYVGETNADGRLKDPDGMIAAGVIEPAAELLVPVWDIDSSIPAHWPMRPEVDVAYINGRKLGTLRGSDSTWSWNKFQVSIRDLKFPNAIGGAVENEVLVQIDTENGTPNWCTAIEWVSLTLKAMVPVVLVHGNNSDPQFFERRGCARGLREAHVPFVFGPQLQVAPTETNGAFLAGEFQKLVGELGSSGIHVIAHSKGGLDSRWAFHLLRSRQPGPDFVPVVPYSLSTLSTPHHGSFLARLKTEYEDSVKRGALVEFSGFPRFAETVTRAVSSGPATASLTPAAAAKLAEKTQLTAFVATIFAAGDADLNDNKKIDVDGGNLELIDLVDEDRALRAVYDDGGFGPLRAAFAVDAMYRTLAEVAEIRTRSTWRSARGGRFLVSELVAIPAAVRQPNDTLVSMVSGLAADGGAWPAHARVGYSGGSGKNHANIASAEVCRGLARMIIDIDRQRGGMR